MVRYIPLVFIWIAIACGAEKENSRGDVSEKPTIAVVNYPMYYFAKSIAGDLATVYLPSITGDPAYWNPTARQVVRFQNADLILANGAGYAKWMEKVSLPSSRIVNTSRSFKDLWIQTDEIMVHSHGPEGEHSHKGTAAITWLNFKFAQLQAVSIHAAIAQQMPDNADLLNNNLDELKRQLHKLDEKIASIALRLSNQYIIASHPVYQYLESEYNLNLINLHWEPNEMPDDKQWIDFSDIIDEHKVKIMLWEDMPSLEISTKLSEHNVKIAVFDICANRPDDGTFLGIMENNLDQIEQILAKQ